MSLHQKSATRALTPERVRTLYWGQGLSAKIIATRFGVSAPTVLLRMAEWGIPTRVHYDRGRAGTFQKEST